MPVRAAGAVERAGRARSAGRRPRPARLPPTRSSRTALVQVPIGRSVSSGCSAWPSQVPLRASLTGPGGDGVAELLADRLRGLVELLEVAELLDRVVGRGAVPSSWSWRRQYPSPPMSDLVLSEDRGPVRHVVLNRPEKRNAFNGELVARDRSGAARGGRRSGRALRRGARRRPDVLLRAWTSARWRTSRRRPSGCARSGARCLEAWNLAEEMAKPVICAIHGALHRRRDGARARVRPARDGRRRGRRGCRRRGSASSPTSAAPRGCPRWSGSAGRRS